jgi:hypothetical protein
VLPYLRARGWNAQVFVRFGVFTCLFPDLERPAASLDDFLLLLVEMFATLVRPIVLLRV